MLDYLKVTKAPASSALRRYTDPIFKQDNKVNTNINPEILHPRNIFWVHQA